LTTTNVPSMTRASFL